MSLRIVCGRAGTGKSKFCFEEIREKINKRQSIYMITPEQFSFTAEQKLLDVCENGSSLYAEVITFGRMANRVLEAMGGKQKCAIATQGKQMLLYSILNKEKKSLNFLGKSRENVELLDRTITELKKHNVSLEKIDEQIKNTKSVYLTKKLEDISRVYHAYEEKLKDKYFDENDSLNFLIAGLEKSELFNGSEIYIDEFAGFTAQEYEIIRILLRKANRVTITICAEKLSEVQEDDIFYSNYVTASKLCKIAMEENIAIEKTKILKEAYRFKNDELRLLEQNLYAYPNKKSTETPKYLHLFLASNPYSEIEQVAEQINKLVQEKKYRYRDIAIITKSQEEYGSLIKAIFAIREIPVFVDEKKDLSENIFVKFLLSVLEIFAKGWSTETVLGAIKTGFFNIEKSDIFKIENYCLSYGIKGKSWYEKDWNLEKEEETKKLNELRGRIVEPLRKLQNVLNSCKTVKQITEELYAFLTQMQIEEKINKKMQKVIESGKIDIAEEYQLSMQIVVRTLEQIVELFGEDKISFEKYLDLLRIGFKVDMLGKIPASLDQVILGDVERSRSHRVKAVFIIGVNDGVFPSIQKEEGFLNDNDREELKQAGLELAKGSYENLYEDQFNIYKVFSVAEEEIYISYISSDKEGKALRPSVLIYKLKKIFPELKEDSDVVEKTFLVEGENATFETLLKVLHEKGESIPDVWKEVYNYYLQSDKWQMRLNAAMRGMNPKFKADTIEKDKIQKLYGKILKTSVSKLEQYRKCPFSFHLKYGLRLQEKPEFKLKGINTGSFMHEVIEKFFGTIDAKKIDINQLEEEEIKKIVSSVIEQILELPKNYLFSSTPKFRSLTARLRKVVTKSITYIVYQLQNSNFEVCGTEIEFSDTSAYEPIKLELETGEKIEVTGKIDRVDIAKTEERKIFENY